MLDHCRQGYGGYGDREGNYSDGVPRKLTTGTTATSFLMLFVGG